MRKPLPTSTTLGQKEADKLRSAAAGPLDTIRSTADHLVAAIRGCLERRRKIEADSRLTTDAKLSDLAEEEDKLATTVAEIDERRLQARRQLDELAADPDLEPASTEEALLAEMRLGRVWASVLRLLEVGHDAIAIATDAATEGDRSVFTALREEYPSYARSAGIGTDQVETEMKALDTIEAPLLSAFETAAREVRAEVVEIDALAVQAVGWARSDGSSAQSIPGPDGTMITMATADLPAVA